MISFYLDANVLITLLDNTDVRQADLIEGLSKINEIEDAEFVVSDFTFVEITKVLINAKNWQPKATARKVNSIIQKGEIEHFRFRLVPTSPDNEYDFDQFWIDVSQNMTLYNPGWGDAIHCVIMANNKIKNIVSMDQKDDFRIVPGLDLIDPLSAT